MKLITYVRNVPCLQSVTRRLFAVTADYHLAYKRGGDYSREAFIGGNGISFTVESDSKVYASTVYSSCCSKYYS